MVWLVTITGAPGVGKTTLAGIVAESLPARLLTADHLVAGNPFLARMHADAVRWCFHNQVWCVVHYLTRPVSLPLTLCLPQVMKEPRSLLASGALR